MSGHSKWANIKHKKGKQDAIKGKVFTKIGRELQVAAKMGGPNPEANFRLKIAIQKAKAANMPNENIQRAIQRASGQDSNNYEELTYEGYGPAGVAIMVDILTDNRNRTAGDIRHIFSKNGGNMGEAGCVSWMFKQKGVLTIKKEALAWNEDDFMLLALEQGAEDIKWDEEDGLVEIITPVQDFQTVKEGLEEKGIQFDSAEVTMLPDTIVEVKDPEQARLLLRLMDYLEDHDDVQATYTNFDIPDELIEQLQ